MLPSRGRVWNYEIDQKMADGTRRRVRVNAAATADAGHLEAVMLGIQSVDDGE
jgi:hypothetical protein